MKDYDVNIRDNKAFHFNIFQSWSVIKSFISFI